MDQTLTTRFVSRFEHPALHPRLHHREGFPIHYLPPREPSPRRICYNSRSTKLLSQTTTSQPRGTPVAKQPQITSTEEGYTNQTPPLTRGSKPQSSTSIEEGTNQSPDQPLPKRDTTKSKGVYNLEASTTSNNLFSTKQRS